MLAKASLKRIKNTFARNELQELILHQLFEELGEKAQQRNWAKIRR